MLLHTSKLHCMKYLYFIVLSLALLPACSSNPPIKSNHTQFLELSTEEFSTLERRILDSLEAELYRIFAYQDTIEFNTNQTTCGSIPRLQIKMNARNQILVRGETVRSISEVREGILHTYRMNRDLTQEETQISASKPDYKGFRYPFYSYLTQSDIESHYNRIIGEFQILKNIPNIAPETIEYLHKQLEGWYNKQVALTTLETDVLPQIHFGFSIHLNYQNKSQKAPLLNEILQAFITLRNEASHKYFNEPYAEIWFRFLEEKKHEDELKLDALKTLHPIVVLDIPHCEETCSCVNFHLR